MIKITRGSEAAIKAEMKAKTIEIKEQMKKLRKRIREERKQDNPDTVILVSLEADLKFYRPSRVLPVQVGDIVVNFKAIQKFLKILDGFNYSISLEGGHLRIDYGMGYVEFHDLSSYYEGFQFIPKGEI